VKVAEPQSIDKSRMDVKSYVEFIGAAAVLFGLIFVGLELRQNTAAVEAATLQDLTDASVDWITNIASDPDLTRLFLTQTAALADLSEVERQQLHLLYRAQWFRFQNAFLQWNRGTLDEDDWLIYEGFICRVRTDAAQSTIAADIRVTTWNDHRAVLLDQFVVFVEACRSDYSRSNN